MLRTILKISGAKSLSDWRPLSRLLVVAMLGWIIVAQASPWRMGLASGQAVTLEQLAELELDVELADLGELDSEQIKNLKDIGADNSTGEFDKAVPTIPNGVLNQCGHRPCAVSAETELRTGNPLPLLRPPNLS